MKNKPLVSFLIPYYNHKQYIGQTLDSILNDTYPNKEIVIINDGSTDTDISVINDWIERNSNKNFKLLQSLYLTAKKNYKLFNKPYKGYLLRKKISYQIQMIFFPLKHLSRMIKGKLYK